MSKKPDFPDPARRKVDRSEDSEPGSQRPCMVCNQVPESIICLSCDHNVDIPCATQLILKEAERTGEADVTRIRCVCGEVTSVSEEVQAAIIAYDAGEDEEELGEEEGQENYAEEEQFAEGEAEAEEEQLEEEADFENSKAPKANDKSNSRTTDHQVKVFQGQLPPSMSRPGGKKSVSEAKEVQPNINELSLHFACMNHPSEEYAYYSSSNKMLYCAQCLLEDKSLDKSRDLKPLKRSLPIISQHLQELLNNVEVSRGLLENRQRDAEIRIEDFRVKTQSIRYNHELQFDELAERILACKQQFVEAFDKKAETVLAEVIQISDQSNDQLEYLEAIVEQIRQIQEV